VVPVALLGTFAVLLALGFSINVLTMFGMVLVIGIVVDDAIVVVENVERIMSEEGLPPHEATRKAMGQIQGAIIGITVVLVSVFVPLAFFSGSVGNIYRQFAAVMVVVHPVLGLHGAVAHAGAVCFAAQAGRSGPPPAKRGPFGLFNRFFQRTADNYGRRVDSVLPRAAHAGDLRPDHRGGGLCLPAPAHLLPAGGGPGQPAGQRATAPGATLERTRR
jgi:multidrug efflux pump